MLDRKRYISATDVFQLRGYINGAWDPLEKETLLEEHLKTQMILSKVNSIELIKIYPTETQLIPDNPTAISIIGMPNAGKTTTANTIIDSREFEIPILVEEIYREEKAKLDSSEEFNFKKLFDNILIRQNSEFDNAVMDAEFCFSMGLNMEKLIIFDRLVWTDIPMFRAHFLTGNINYITLRSVEKEFENRLNNPRKKTSDVIISCIIKPEVSLSRQSPNEGSGRIMNQKFLQVLYEQYLRFHYEMTNYKKIYKKDRPFTYSTVDMSGSDGFPRFRNLEKIINWSHIMQGGDYDNESINEFIAKQ